MDTERYLRDQREALRASVEYFRAANINERNLWVAREFLQNLNLAFADSEVVAPESDPPDVIYRDLRFEVKEILDEGRKRHAEFKVSLQKAEEATDPQQLLSHYSPKDLEPAQVIELIVAKLPTYSEKYAPAFRSTLDLLVYVNLGDYAVLDRLRDSWSNAFRYTGALTMTKTKTKKHLQIHQMTIAQFEQLFPHEDACKAYLTANRWPDGTVRCPRCGNDNVHEHARPFHWNCYQCSTDGVGYRFSVLVGTIFENTNKPLRDWFRVMHMMLTSKKGISALQIYRVMGFGSYNTALLMCNKIRVALGNVEFKQLIGYVEVDETYVGGKAKNKHKGPGGRGDFGGTGGTGKAVVVGAVQRKGNVIARVIANIDTKTMDRFVRETVSTKVSLLSTDEHKSYRHLDHWYRHGFVRHGQDEYVHGAIHTNTIEGFWSLVKRGIVGTFHKVSHQHLPLYVNEFEFRYNNRNNPDIFRAAVRAC